MSTEANLAAFRLTPIYQEWFAALPSASRERVHLSPQRLAADLGLEVVRKPHKNGTCTHYVRSSSGKLHLMAPFMLDRAHRMAGLKP